MEYIKNLGENNTNTIEVKRVLMVLSSVNITGGVSNKIMDIYRNVDRQRVQFDFLIHVCAEKSFESEINALGGNIYYFGKIGNIGLIRYLKQVYKLIKSGNYSVVHSHIGFNSGIILFLARIAGVKLRISHSRGAIDKKGLKKILIPVMKLFIKINANKFLASSVKAGENLYGSQDFEVIPNALNIERFLRASKDECLIEKIDIEDKMIILGHVGRFTSEKNHDFLLLIATKLKEFSMNFKFVLVGDGILRKEFEKKVQLLDLEKYFYFAGDRTDVEKYYPLFHVLLFPSYHEGFGNVAIEAQVAKRNVIASEGVPREVDLGLNLIEFISLNNLDGWINAICNIYKQDSAIIDNASVNKALVARGFDIESTVLNYYKIYKV